MKVFFTASLRGKQYYLHNFERIYKAISDNGYENLDEEILSLKISEFYEKLEHQGRNAFVDLYNKKIERIQKADICIFETSLHSHSIGFEIHKSLEYMKPTIGLYLKNNIPHFLAGIKHDKFLLYEYDDISLEKVIKKALKEASNIRDKRFNFFISPNLLNYLDKISVNYRLTKSAYIRNLIIDDMKKRNS
jgi:hypothetical protein